MTNNLFRILFYLSILLTGYSGYAQTEYQWRGTNSSHWNDPSNWLPAGVPGSNVKVVIDGSLSTQFPVLNEPVNLYHLVMQNDAKLDVADSRLSVQWLDVKNSYFINSGEDPIEIAVSSNMMATIGNTNFAKDVRFILSGSVIFVDGTSAGGNTFEGDVTYEIASSGSLTISGPAALSRSVYKGNLTVERTVGGETNFFTVNAAPQTVVHGDFVFHNPAGGNVQIGHNITSTHIGGNMTVEVSNPTSATNNFYLYNVSNGEDGNDGNVTVGNLNWVAVKGCDLHLNQFKLTGVKNYAIDIVDNRFDVPGGFHYEDVAPNGTYAGLPVLRYGNNQVDGPAKFVLRTDGDYREGGVGNPNVFNGDVTVVADGFGSLMFSFYKVSEYNGKLQIERTQAGYTSFFQEMAESVTIPGDFTYVNKAGGETYFGYTGNGPARIQVGGTLNIDYEATTTQPNKFILAGFENHSENGKVSILNPGEMVVKNNTLELSEFQISGQKGGDVLFDNNIFKIQEPFYFQNGKNPTLEWESTRRTVRISQSTFDCQASFLVYDNADLYDALSYPYEPNVFKDDVTFVGGGPGTLHVSDNLEVSQYRGSVSIYRYSPGDDYLFTESYSSKTIGGDLLYVNTQGGHTQIGSGAFAASLQINGRLSITYNGDANGNFSLLKTKNLTGGGNMVIENPQSLTLCNNTLIVDQFEITGGEGEVQFADNSVTTSSGFVYTQSSSGTSDAIFSGNVFTGDVIYEAGGGTIYDASSYDIYGDNEYRGNLTYRTSGSGQILAARNWRVFANGNVALQGDGITINWLFEMNGTADATLSAEDFLEKSFNGLTVNKRNGARVKLLHPVKITGYLSLFAGQVETSEAAPLLIEPSATIAIQSTSTHVIGPLQVRGKKYFEAPVGNGVTACFVNIQDGNAGPNTVYEIEFVSHSPGQDNYDQNQLDEGLHRLLPDGYWKINRFNGTGEAMIELWYSFPDGYVTNSDELAVAHWDGSKWVSQGGLVNEYGPFLAVQTATPVSSFSPFTIASTGPSNPLPVRLVSFEVSREQNQNVLIWETSREINAAFFEIERSRDGQRWTSIGKIDATGDMESGRHYRFTDTGFEMNGITFYRLKMVDQDGTFTFSQVRSIAVGVENEPTVYPNPASDFITLETGGLHVLGVELVDVLGKKLRADYREVGRSHIVLDVQRFTSGEYFLKVNTSAGVITKKVTIIR